MINSKNAEYVKPNKEGRKVRGLEVKPFTCHCERAEGVGRDTYPADDKLSGLVPRPTKLSFAEFVPFGMTDDINVKRNLGWVKPNKRTAFTLAEVLITLGVIGVVSAITIPSIISNYKEKQTVAQLSKVYSTISQAWQRMETEYGSIDSWGMDGTNTGTKDVNGNTIYDYTSMSMVAERLQEFLKVSKNCKVGEICYPYPQYRINGTLREDVKSETVSDGAQFFLADGTFVSMGYYSKNTNTLDISVILPGSKKAVFGKNAFYFKATSFKITPEGANASSFNEECKPTGSNTGWLGRACTAWVLYNKNMDYLHCPDDLSWNGKTKCK